MTSLRLAIPQWHTNQADLRSSVRSCRLWRIAISWSEPCGIFLPSMIHSKSTISPMDTCLILLCYAHANTVEGGQGRLWSNILGEFVGHIFSVYRPRLNLHENYPIWSIVQRCNVRTLRPGIICRFALPPGIISMGIRQPSIMIGRPPRSLSSRVPLPPTLGTQAHV
jgi:hypothetical protein